MAKVRAPTRSLTRTYVRRSPESRRYQALVVMPDHSSRACTRDDLDDAVRCVRRRVGIK